MMLCALALGWALSAPDLAVTAPVAESGLNNPDPDRIDTTNHPGKALFQQHCASCHEGGMAKAPHPTALAAMAPDAIVEALTQGIMRQEAAALGQEQRRQIAEYLTASDLSKFKPAPGAVMCAPALKSFDLKRPPARVGWGYDTRRFVPASVAGFGATAVKQLKLKWAFAFPNAIRARSQPVIAMGAVFVGSQDGTIYAFDLKTGCAKWTSKVSAEVRTAIVVEPWAPGTKPPHPPRLFFGDFLGRVYAMDAQTGKLLWRAIPDEHPNATITGTPALFDGKVIVPISSFEVSTARIAGYECCTFRGSVAALDADSGKMVWKQYTVPAPSTSRGRTASGRQMFGPSGAPVWGSPLVDARRGLIYFGSGENYSSPADGNSDALFAVDARTGARRWVFQLTAGDAWNTDCMVKGENCPAENGPDFDVAASPIMADIGGGRQAVIVGQKSGMVYAVDPDNGKVIWKRQVGRGGLQGGIRFGMALRGNRLFVGVSDLPMQSDGSLSPAPGFPGLHALDVRTGQSLWHASASNRCKQSEQDMCGPGISSAISALPGVVFAGHIDGMFRAYDENTGATLWEFDTRVPRQAVNGPLAQGGTISGPGPAIADGYVVTNSGYGIALSMPGNALLVFSVNGK